MTKRVRSAMSGQMVVLMITAVTLIVLTGCRTTPQPPLLGDRGVVPPAYSEPGASAPPPAVEPLPQLPEAQTQLDSLLPPEPVTELEEELLESEPAPLQGTLELPPVIESKPQTYTVKKGDSLWKIAQAYGITYQELAAYNSMDVDETLKAGAVLQLPPSASFIPPEDRDRAAAGASSATPSGTVPAAGKTYTVQKGDNLWNIAKRFNVKVSDLKALNKLDSPDVIVPGQKLVLPKSAQAAASSAAVTPPVQTQAVEATPELAPPTPPVADDTATAETPPTPPVTDKDVMPAPVRPPTDAVALPNLLDHTVLDDDTLKSIAAMYGTTVEKIKEANPTIETDEDLIPNMKILVPID